jgi:hypothetical protein
MRRCVVSLLISALIAPAVLAQSHIIRKTGTDVPDWGSWGDHTGTRSPDDPVVLCPTGTFVTGIKVFRSDHAYGPIVHFRYSCGNPTNPSIAVRMDDPGVPQDGAWPDYPGSRWEGSYTAQCPTGSFVAGIEGFKRFLSPVGLPVLRGLRYLCADPASGALTRKRTDHDIALTGSTSFGGGTANMDNPVVKCPDGYFVTGIQGFRITIPPGIPWGEPVNPIDELRYICDH